MKQNNKVCPLENAEQLDSVFRRYFQNPRKIMKQFLTDGLTVLDFGCGTGFFTIEIAKILENSGKVIAADLQDGMLKKVKNKIEN